MRNKTICYREIKLHEKYRDNPYVKLLAVEAEGFYSPQEIRKILLKFIITVEKMNIAINKSQRLWFNVFKCGKKPEELRAQTGKWLEHFNSNMRDRVREAYWEIQDKCGSYPDHLDSDRDPSGSLIANHWKNNCLDCDAHQWAILAALWERGQKTDVGLMLFPGHAAMVHRLEQNTFEYYDFGEKRDMKVYKNVFGLSEKYIDKIKSGLRIDQLPFIIYLNRANALSKTDQIITAYNKAISYYKLYAGIYIGRGVEFRSLGKIKNAIRDFKQTLKIDPNAGTAYWALGMQYFALNRYEKAIKYFTRARVHLNINNKKSYIMDSYLYQALAFHKLGNYLDALKCYNEVIALMPDCLSLAEYYFEPGAIYFKLGRYSEAQKAFTRSLKSSPHDAKPYNNLGMVFYKLNEYNKADALFNRALKLAHSDFIEPHNNLGKLYHEYGEFEKAIEHYRIVMAKKPGFAEAYINCGRSYYELGKYNMALNMYKRGLKKHIKSAEIFTYMGDAHYDQSLYKKALAYYNLALKTDPKYIDALYRKGHILTNLGRRQEAQAYYLKAKQLTAAANTGNGKQYPASAA
ncbi:MAG: tetratricopeptide repeat protein [Candidatus Margulisiibacteriota bacterium]